MTTLDPNVASQPVPYMQLTDALLLRAGPFHNKAPRHLFQTAGTSESPVLFHWQSENDCHLEEGWKTHLGVLPIQHEDH